jgi:hypothetical protein
LYSCSELHADAQKAFRQYWFIQSIQIGQETDHTLSLRLHIRTDLFVQAFVGEISGSLLRPDSPVGMPGGGKEEKTSGMKSIVSPFIY